MYKNYHDKSVYKFWVYPVIQIGLVDLFRGKHCLAHRFTEADTRCLPFNYLYHCYLVISWWWRKLFCGHLSIVGLSNFFSKWIVMQLLYSINIGWCQCFVDVRLIDVARSNFSLKIFCGLWIKNFRIIFKSISGSSFGPILPHLPINFKWYKWLIIAY